MKKELIIELLIKKYTAFVDDINGLTDEEYSFSYLEKWTAGQQLAHIVLCIKPLVQVFGMDKSIIEQNFGLSDRPGQTYEMLLKNYLKKLKEGGKAPERYVPENTSPNQKAALTEELTKMIKQLCLEVESFTEQELDHLCIPHPLLGRITLREMLYNAIYHVQHHQELIALNLIKQAE